MLAGLERVGLAAHAHERAGVFSRGMAQRLNLARVLMLEPDLLLLDEPGTGLDAASLALLRREVRDARQRGACVVLISHDLAGDAPWPTACWPWRSANWSMTARPRTHGLSSRAGRGRRGQYG